MQTISQEITLISVSIDEAATRMLLSPTLPSHRKLLFMRKSSQTACYQHTDLSSWVKSADQVHNLFYKGSLDCLSSNKLTSH